MGRKILYTSLVGVIGAAGIAGLGARYSGSDDREKIQEKKVDRSFLEVFKYIDENPQRSEAILNYSLNSIKREQGDISAATVRNLAEVVREEATINPDRIKDEIVDISSAGLVSDYRSDIFDNLTVREKVDVADSLLRHQTKDSINEAEDFAQELIERFKGTKLYDELNRFREENSDDILKLLIVRSVTG